MPALSPQSLDSAIAALERIIAALRAGDMPAAAEGWLKATRCVGANLTFEQPEEIEGALMEALDGGRRSDFLLYYRRAFRAATAAGKERDAAGLEAARVASDESGLLQLSPGTMSAALLREEVCWRTVLSADALELLGELLRYYPALSRARLIEELLGDSAAAIVQKHEAALPSSWTPEAGEG